MGKISREAIKVERDTGCTFNREINFLQRKSDQNTASVRCALAENKSILGAKRSEEGLSN